MLRKYNLGLDDYFLHEEGGRDYFQIAGISCSLCQLYDVDCSKCSLAKYLGASCDSRPKSPYQKFRDYGEVEPMIEALQGTLKKWKQV